MMTAALKQQQLKSFTELEGQTWKELFSNLEESRKSMVVDIFVHGIEELGLCADKIPDLEDVNRKLYAKTGWRGVPVEGLEDANSFYPALARKEFPIGNFIRENQDLNYTPAPDIFHDLYGHIPFYMDKDYADACWDFCRRASEFSKAPDKMRMFERFFWFTYEFGLVETPAGRRIFGGGILSSYGESIYSLSDKPEVISFNIEKLIQQEFRIDVFQEKLFVLKSPEQLYNANEEVERLIRNS